MGRVLPILAALLVSSCAAKGLETPYADKLSRTIALLCTTTAGGMRERPIILKIEYGKGGWVRVDSAARGVRDNAYWNERHGQIVCGSRSWAGREFIPMTEEEFRQENGVPPLS